MTSAFINMGLCGFAGAPIGWVSLTGPVAGPVILFGGGARNLISGIPNSAGIIFEDLSAAQRPAQILPDVFIPEGEGGVFSERELTTGDTAGSFQRSAKFFGKHAAAAGGSGVGDDAVLPPQEELERMAQGVLKDPNKIVRKIPNERVRIAVAKICAVKDGRGTAARFKNFGITDSSAKIEIATLLSG